MEYIQELKSVEQEIKDLLKRKTQPKEKEEILG
jgi:hypothetical protein